MKRFVLIAIITAISSNAFADNEIDSKLKTYQSNLNAGVDALVAAGAESQKGNDAEVQKIKSFWGDFHEYKNAPVPPEDKYRNTTFDNPTVYK